MKRLFVMTACVVFGFTSAASAEGTVTGSGTAELHAPPDIMRVRIELVAKGKDLKEALEKLKGRREAAREKLMSLGASKDSITFKEANLGTEAINQQARMRGGYGGHTPPGFPATPKPKGPQPVFVSTTVTAEMPFKPTGGDDLLLAANTIQEKIRAADLGGLKDTGKMTPQEEEIVEEKGLQPTMENGAPKPGEPMFMFVGKFDEALRMKAAAEAFQKAKAHAARLARAAEVDLGEIRDVKEAIGPNVSTDDMDAQEEYYARAAMYGRQDMGGDGSEAISLKPGKVSLRVGVTVKYALKPTGPR